ncbi:MAG: hypothetical protein EZS26_000760 [Candidatus Ordinivivax streblomastigis]|uniref:Uncharacterized protein n=1 Tax=Candidatus Ordinivivax streblomastigis TaxID=2540710 RepID=A0A5M8P3T1_9BACT|nr:MAG: hypothetical protein EZS26_000760 [Candidatus Ordinivivax streblomastigis]
MNAVVLLSKTFFPQHPKAGMQTEFASKVRVSVSQAPIHGNFYKIHTCRSNYEYWKKKIDKLKAGGGVLSVRQWSTSPYRSPQEIIIDISADIVDVQKLQLHLMDDGVLIAYILRNNDWDVIPLATLAANDGLTVEDYKAWFAPVFEKEKAEVLDFAIIHFTTFRY